MLSALSFPNIDPVLFSIGSLQVRWYGLFYIIAFVIGYIFIKKNLRKKEVNITNEQYDTMLFNTLLGVIIGGRLGYVLFYNLSEYLQHPLKIFAVWEGGMSFHGGAIAVLLLGYFFVKRNRLRFYPLADAVVPFAALGLGLGRIGNFINAELYGRVTNVPWAMIFPGSDGLPRHPSQLYQAFFEGLLLFVILQFLYTKRLKEGFVFWTFIALYGVFRFFIEFYREPDPQLGFVILDFTMGQVLCFLMIITASIGFYNLYKPKVAKK
ncbi:MAG: prolipoprotein diacylglyceryl transferase [Candidatus Cloacimonetes bacterium]|nr:prolipoprotein diacylglyceryl transferase [Candidatus Cloacimonadota bacterium]